MTTFSLSPLLVIARKRAVFALRAEFSSLSFPKEKVTKKKGNLRACALKNPLIVQSCYAQSKMSCSPLLPLRVVLRRPSDGENCTKREEKSRGDHWSPAPTAGVAVRGDFDHRNPHFAVTPTVGVKMDSDHQNSFSRQTPAAGVTIGIHFHGNTHRRC